MKILKRKTPSLGPDGLAEMRLLLEGLPLTGQESVLRRGRAVDVMMTIWPSSEGADCFDAHLSAFASGGERVRFGDLKLWARGQDEQGTVLRFAELTSIGDLSLKGLRKGLIYRLHLPKVGIGEWDAPLPIWEGKLTATTAAVPPREATDLPRYDSADGKVVATLQVKKDDQVTLAFETREAALAGAVVPFLLVSQSGRVEHSETVRLEPARGGRWEGRWSGSLRLARPCRLLFEVLPLPPEIAGEQGRRQATEPEADPVDCTVYAPPTVAPGAALIVQVFAHRPEQADQAGALAREFDEAAQRRGFRSLEMDVVRNTRLTFHVALPGLEIDDPVQSLLWRGWPEAVQVGVRVPADFQPGLVVGTVTVSQDSVPLGHIKFRLQVSPQSAAAGARPLGEQAQRYRKVFISYASTDRAEVLKRVQMLERMKVPYFQDVLSLEPGERWERALYRHIDECDLFLLFWSRAARDSEWVLKEVRHAMERKGGNDLALPEIIPVILEGPPPVEPPEELKPLHFNDRLLYFMRTPVG